MRGVGRTSPLTPLSFGEGDQSEVRASCCGADPESSENLVPHPPREDARRPLPSTGKAIRIGRGVSYFAAARYSLFTGAGTGAVVGVAAVVAIVVENLETLLADRVLIRREACG